MIPFWLPGGPIRVFSLLLEVGVENRDLESMKKWKDRFFYFLRLPPPIYTLYKLTLFIFILRIEVLHPSLYSILLFVFASADCFNSTHDLLTHFRENITRRFEQLSNYIESCPPFYRAGDPSIRTAY